MSYVRPPVLTAGDIVKGTHMSILRADWAAYETHDHNEALAGKRGPFINI